MELFGPGPLCEFAFHVAGAHEDEETAEAAFAARFEEFKPVFYAWTGGLQAAADRGATVREPW
jgi:hypothetical protein